MGTSRSNGRRHNARSIADSRGVEKGVAVVDVMVIVHKMKSTHSFNELLLSMAGEYDEIILVFDTYKNVSLRYETREARLQGQCPVRCLVHGEKYIKHITMKRFLSHDKAKADLANYIEMQVLTYHTDTSNLVITSSSGLKRTNGSLEC